MFTINGTEIATPTDYTPSIMSVDKAERNANGTMIIENIATKRKLDLTWNVITQSEMSVILGLLNASRFVSVEYLEPETGVLTTKTFYSGDKGVGAYPLYTSGVLSHWSGFNVSLIEQ